MHALIKSSAAGLLLASAPLVLAAPLTVMLNWTPTADHAALYYAKEQAWYKDAGIDFKIETGRGSALSAQRVGAGAVPVGISDLPTAMQIKGKGGDLKAVMVIYANSPQGFYWLKSSGIKGPKDFAGKKIGNPPGDASRAMWPAFASKVGIEPKSVNFVNLSPQAKVAALKAKSVDIISDFYNEHDLKVREFGDDLGYVAWPAAGVNVYGNSFIVNGAYLQANTEQIKTFVQITQRAYAACVQNFDPCLKAMMDDVSGLDADNQRKQWNRIKELMRDDTTKSVALGAFSSDRIAADYQLVDSLIGLEKGFEPATLFTNEFLKTDVRMSAE